MQRAAAALLLALVAARAVAAAAARPLARASGVGRTLSQDTTWNVEWDVVYGEE